MERGIGEHSIRQFRRIGDHPVQKPDKDLSVPKEPESLRIRLKAVPELLHGRCLLRWKAASLHRGNGFQIIQCPFTNLHHTSSRRL